MSVLSILYCLWDVERTSRHRAKETAHRQVLVYYHTEIDFSTAARCFLAPKLSIFSDRYFGSVFRSAGVSTMLGKSAAYRQNISSFSGKTRLILRVSCVTMFINKQYFTNSFVQKRRAPATDPRMLLTEYNEATPNKCQNVAEGVQRCCDLHLFILFAYAG